MDNLLKHMPEIDEESGTEYPWSIAIGKIKGKKEQWKEIENLISSKISIKEGRKKFIQSVLDKLIEIKIERFLSIKHEKYGKKEELLEDLEKIEENICNLQKSLLHTEYHDFLHAHLSKKDWVFEDGENPSAEAMDQIENNLELMRGAAKKAIEHYKGKEKLRPNFSTFKKTLKDSLACHIAAELEKAGIRPTRTRNGIFDKVFCLSCKIIELVPISPGSKHIERAVDKLKGKSI